ncbi:MAG: hypothetical protein O7F14_07795, partial [Alphaproteobacteria bacterium]|nr:hypothetical protein [Alphaproteobacteria bacterium]
EQLEEMFFKLELIQDVCIGQISEEEYDMRGEGLCIVIEPSAKYGDNPNQMAESLRELADSLAAYKRPTHMVINTDPLPKTHSLKTKRFLVRERLKNQVLVKL